MDRRFTSHRGRTAAALGALTMAAAATATASATAQDATAPLPAPNTITVVGSARVKPVPNNRHDNASIARSVRVARAAGVPKAIANGRGRAAALSAASGIGVGALLSIAEPSSGPPFFYDPGQGTFGPDRYCGTVRPVRFRINAAGKRVRVPGKPHRTCRVPPYVNVSLTLVFATAGSTNG